jgi:glycine reductase complex component B subunit gamma
MRVVHYVNQFQAGIGGEDAAGSPPQRHDGPVGPGRLLARLLGGDHEVVATVSCGDDHAASAPDAIPTVLALAREAGAELLVAGPAFGSGRYGLACGRLVAAAATEGLPAVAAMHPDNPGVDAAGQGVVVGSSADARQMAASMETLAAAARTLAGGAPVTAADGRIGRVPRRNTVADARSAARAVDLALTRLAGDRDATEIPRGQVDEVAPAGPVKDPSTAVLALATEGGLVPAGNPDRLEAARATRWVPYPIDGLQSLDPGAWISVDGGFSTAAADADPHRLVPLDVARELEKEGRIGGLHNAFLVTTGNATAVANVRRFGVEWAAELRRAGVLAIILTAT